MAKYNNVIYNTMQLNVATKNSNQPLQVCEYTCAQNNVQQVRSTCSNATETSKIHLL